MKIFGIYNSLICFFNACPSSKTKFPRVKLSEPTQNQGYGKDDDDL